MSQDQQPIIARVEGLGELVFPPGTSEEAVDRAVQDAIRERQRAPSSLDDALLSAQERLTRPPNAGANALPEAGGTLGGLVGGRFGSPTIGAAIGGGAGTIARNLATERPVLEDVPLNTALQGTVAKGGELVGRGVAALAGPVSHLADKVLKGALKIDRGYLSKMPGGGRGNFTAREDEIIRTARAIGGNPLSHKTAARLDDELARTMASREAKITAAPDVPVPRSGARAVHAGRRVTERLGRGEAPQQRIAASKATVDDIIDSPRTGEAYQQRVSFQPQASSILDPSGQPVTRLSAVPGQELRRAKDLTPRQLADTIEETNNELRGLFGDTKLGPRAQTLMGTQGARRESLNRAAGTAPESEALRKLIDLRNVSNITRHRSATHNPVTLTDIISLNAGRPMVMAGSVAMKPRMLGAIGNALSQAAPAMARSGRPAGFTAEQLQRALLMLIMGDKSPPQDE